MTRNANMREPGEIERIAKRRQLVAELRLRGLTQEEISAGLVKAKVVNADGEPYTQSTISKDLAAIRDEWGQLTAVDLTTHRAREMAEINYIKREAFKKGNLSLVHRCIETEIKLLGTAQPIKIEMTIELLEIIYVVVDKLKEVGADPASVFNDFYVEISAQAALHAGQQSPRLVSGQSDIPTASD